MQHLTRDGVALAYEERGPAQGQGSGIPPLVFVHGWSCDHEYFAPQVDHFSARHRTVAVDLRGHGASDAPEQPYTMAGFADDLVWLCAQLNIEKPVILGHSMGAVVALELAARHPAVPSAIVMVDGGTRTMAPPPPGGDGSALARVMRDGSNPAAIRAAIDNMFLPTDNAERRAWITERMLGRPPHVMASAWEELRRVDGVASAKACTVPVLHINAATYHPELALFRELCPQLVLGQTVGAGHFNMLEVPDQVNAMIEQFLLTSVRPPA
jgi:pimeloyl-ACP methyl ester carboxylesterase